MAQQTIDFVRANGFEALREQFGIKVTHYQQYGFYSLAYDHINSPKMNPIVQECRGLILDEEANIVSRAFDRFFDFGEADTKRHEHTAFHFFPKIDGSLIKFFHHKGLWHIGTKTMGDANYLTTSGLRTYEGIVYDILGVKNKQEFTACLNGEHNFNPDCTYIYELTSPENRVVTPYKHDELHWSAVRFNQGGGYVENRIIKEMHGDFPAKHYEMLPFHTVADAKHNAAKLGGLQEGYVGYLNNVPTIKVKSRLHEVAALIAFEGLHNKRVIEILALREEDLYCHFYPEARPVFDMCKVNIKELERIMEEHFDMLSFEPDQKSFSMAVSPYVYSPIMFAARRNNTTPKSYFYNMSHRDRTKFLVDRADYVTGDKKWFDKVKKD